MRICIDARKINDLGVGTYLQGILEQLKTVENPHTFLLLTAPDEQKQLSQLFPPPRFNTVAEPAKKYSIRELFSITRRLHQIQADLYHSPHYPLPLLKIRPTITIIHDLIHLKFPEYLPSQFARLYARGMMNHAVRRSDHIVTISAWSKRDLQERFPIADSRISVVYGAVGEDFKILESGQVENFIEQKLGGRKPYLLYCGAFKRHKNLGTLLTAFHRIDPDCCQYLVLAGDQLNRYPELQQKIKDLRLESRIINPGWLTISELVKLYNGAKGFVFPSEYEGFGLPPLEAMKCGVPVVASNAACMPEVLGDAACYFDPHSVDQLMSQLKRILTDDALRKQLCAKGFVQAEKYNWHKSALEILNIYKKFEK